MTKEITAEQNPLAHLYDEDGTLKNPKHELYANAYVQTFNRKQSVIACGVDPAVSSVNDIGFRMARRPEVKQRIKTLLAERVEEIAVNEDWIILRLAQIVERSMENEAILNRDGEETGEFKFDGRNANRALELIGNYLGMFKQKDAQTAGQVIINLDYGLNESKKVSITRQPIEGEKV